MQTTEVEYLDGTFTVNEQEPNTLAELIALIGEQDVIENVNANLRYRNKYPRVYRKMSEALTTKSPAFPRAVVDKKTSAAKTVSDVLESPNDHIRAYTKGRPAIPAKEKTGFAGAPSEPAPEGEELTSRTAELQALFDKIAGEEPLFVQGERAGTGGKVSAASLASANTYLAAGQAQADQIAAYIESKVPNYKVGRDAEGAITPESLARAISALNKQAAKEAADKQKAEMSALLGSAQAAGAVAA